MSVLWSRLRSPGSKRRYRFAGAGLLVLTTLFVAAPFLNPYVRIGGNTLRLELSCLPSQISIYVRQSQAAIQGHQLVLFHPDGTGSTTVGRGSQRSSVEKGEKKIEIDIENAQDGLPKGFAEPTDTRKLRMDVTLSRVAVVEINRVEIGTARSESHRWCGNDMKELSGSKLAALIPEAFEKRVMRFDLVPEKLAEWAVTFNDLAANVTLAAMLLWVLRLTFQIAQGVLELAVVPEAHLREKIEEAMKNEPQFKEKGAQAMVCAQFALLCRHFVFARATGPALGFALTVSSLVAAFSPQFQAEQNAFLFLSALQIAMVGTLMGLLIRIFAELAVVVHRRCAEHKIRILSVL